MSSTRSSSTLVLSRKIWEYLGDKWGSLKTETCDNPNSGYITGIFLQSGVQGLFSVVEPFEPKRRILSVTIEISNSTPVAAEPPLAADHMRLVRARTLGGRLRERGPHTNHALQSR